MAKGIATARNARGGSGPVSVVLPADLRARVLAEAKKRGMKLSPALRMLVHERVQELEDDEQLSRAEQWQRAQAWATWEKIKTGDVAEVSSDELDAEFDAALRRNPGGSAQRVPPAGVSRVRAVRSTGATVGRASREARPRASGENPGRRAR